jgi:hypothetical protein
MKLMWNHWSIIGTVEGSDGSIVKQHPINACIIEALPIKLKKCETFLPNWYNRRMNGHLVKPLQDYMLNFGNTLN